MGRRRQWRSWMAVAVMLIAFVTQAQSNTGDRAGIGAAAQAIGKHAQSRRLVLLGESHGTREIPDLVESLVARESALAPIVLALEIPHPEQASLDAFLRSNGDAAARAALRARGFWQRADVHHDGRRSEDMLDLLEQVRCLREAGRDVALLAYDMAADAPRTDRDARDRYMAHVVRAAHDALPRGRVIVLAGNVHAMLARPSYAPPEMQTPMGVHLRDLQPVSVRIGARGGHSWVQRNGRGEPAPADRIERNGPLPSPYTYGVSLERFTVARLIGGAR